MKTNRLTQTALATVSIVSALALACSSPSDGGGGTGGSGAGSGGSGGRGGTGGRGGSGGSAQPGTGGTGTGGGNTGGSGTGGSGSGGSGTGGSGTGGSGTGGSGPAADAGSGDSAGPGGDGSTGMTPERGEVGAAGFPGWKYLRAIKLDTARGRRDGGGHQLPGAGDPERDELRLRPVQVPGRRHALRQSRRHAAAVPHRALGQRRQGRRDLGKVDNIAGNNSTQNINMYWGNASAGDAGDTKGVFAMQDGFVGVWHLDEDGNVSEGGYKDSSGAGNHGTGQGGLAAGARVDARVGKGTKTLNMMDQWVQVPDTTGKFRTTQLTASIWGRADSFPGRSGPGGYDTILSSGEYWTVQKFSLNRVFESCFQHICAVGKTQIATNTWYLFTVVRQGGSHRFYVNGVQDAGSGVNTRADFKPLGMGNQTQYLTNAGEKRSWNGIIDEARVLNVAKDNNWIKLDFESQKEASKFLVFGETQTR